MRHYWHTFEVWCGWGEAFGHYASMAEAVDAWDSYLKRDPERLARTVWVHEIWSLGLGSWKLELNRATKIAEKPTTEEALKTAIEKHQRLADNYKI